MTCHDAAQAMMDRTRVECGDAGTEDYDAGYIVSIDGDLAQVAWDSGVRTPCPIADLEPAR